MPQLSFVDAFVLVLYMLAIVGLGVWLGRGRQDAKRYLLGKQNAPWWAILGSIVATETSTVTFLSVPGFTYADGGDLRFLQLPLGYIVGRCVIVVWLLPLYFRGELFTAYELLERRFGAATQKLASVIFIVTRNLGDGLRLFLTALVLEATIGWSLEWCVVLIGFTTIVFTFAGGMQSVIWNDCIQLCVYVAGGCLALALIVAANQGGFLELLEFARSTNRLRVFDFEFIGPQGPRFDDAYTFWAGMVGGAFLTLGTHGADQMMVQRTLAARSQRDASKAMIASGFVVFFQFGLFLLIGIGLAQFYSLYPPAEEFERTDRVLATYIVEEFPRGIGLIGLLLAAVFSAAMSTLSSSLNSSATAVVTDWIGPNHRSVVTISRGLTVLFGLVQIGIGIWASDFDASVISNALAIAGFSAGLLLGLFALGTLLPRANQRAAIIGLAFGLIVLLGVKFGLSNLPPDSGWRYEVAWPWFPVIGSCVTFAVGGMVTLTTANVRRNEDGLMAP